MSLTVGSRSTGGGGYGGCIHSIDIQQFCLWKILPVTSTTRIWQIVTKGNDFWDSKCMKVFSNQALPRLTGGAYSTPPSPLAWSKWATGKYREGRADKYKRGEERGGIIAPYKQFLDAPLLTATFELVAFLLLYCVTDFIFYVCISIIPSVLWRCWLGSRKGIRPVKTEWWGAGVVVCLDRGADLHMAQLMPLPLTVSCFSKIQTVFFLSGTGSPVLGSTGQRAVKRVCVFKLRDKRSRTRG